ncbi:MAG: hypothetical protein RSF37_12730 [Clostridium sp.]|uniref:hypothetical protein n=1 Tax=Clostridium sp. TaxID=1506 RepID=UPI002FC75374
MKNIDKKSFEEVIKVKPTNIINGFDDYTSAIIIDDRGKGKETELKFYNLLNKYYIEEEKLVADYYGNAIEEDEFNNMISQLEEEDRKILTNIRKDLNKDSIYFEIESKKDLYLLLTLSLKNILFSTFYFKSGEFTIWSNYDYKFVIFFNNESSLKDFEKIAKECELILKDINIVE